MEKMIKRRHTFKRVISQVRICHKDKTTFDKNQKVQLRTQERLCSHKLQKEIKILIDSKVCNTRQMKDYL